MTAACNANIAPLVLPFTNVSVHADSDVEVRGIPAAIGSPAQIIALTPDFNQNTTRISNSQTCQNSLSNLTCAFGSGGLYLTSASSTYAFTSRSGWNGSNTTTMLGTYFNDDLNIASGRLYGFPMYQESINSYYHALGMNVDSPLYTALLSLMLAPVKAFGFWYGSRSTSSPVDGSLIFGGFDENKITGGVTNFTSIPGCPTCTTVSRLDYINSDGTSTSLLDTNVSSFNVFFSPAFSQLQVPTEIVNNFFNASGATYLSDQNYYGWTGGRSPASVRVTFENGYQSMIPGSELSVQPRSVGTDGVYRISNASESVSMMWNDTTAGHLPAWGAPFLAVNYLTFDPDRGIFGLAPVGEGERNTSLKVRSFCSDSANAKDTSSGNISGREAGAVAGGVIGGVAIIVTFCLIFLLKRRAKQRRALAERPSDVHKVGDTKVPSDNTIRYSELSSAWPSANGLTMEVEGSLPMHTKSSWRQPPVEMYAGDAGHEMETPSAHA